MDRRRVLVLAFGALVLAGAGLLARPSQAVLTAACPASVAGTLKNVSRSIVPIGVRAKSFVVRAGDSCDARQVGVVRKTLAKGSTLLVGLGSGGLQVNLRGGFRNPNGNKAPFHLGITLKQGSRTLLDRKLCAWYQSSCLVADRAGISCWW